MSGDFGNPYQSPESQYHSSPQQRVQGRVVAPAIALIVVGVIGLLVSLYNVYFALTMKPEIDPNAPPFLQEMTKNSTGPAATIVQVLFVVVNGIIIVGGVLMARFQAWGMALTSTILAMVNFGTCCCILGIPVGIWSLVILLQPDVKAAFSARTQL